MEKVEKGTREYLVHYEIVEGVLVPDVNSYVKMKTWELDTKSFDKVNKYIRSITPHSSFEISSGWTLYKFILAIFESFWKILLKADCWGLKITKPKS